MTRSELAGFIDLFISETSIRIGPEADLAQTSVADLAETLGDLLAAVAFDVGAARTINHDQLDQDLFDLAAHAGTMFVRHYRECDGEQPYETLVGNCLRALRNTLLSKSADYAAEDNVFAGFERCEQLALIPTIVGMCVRLCDKVGRVENLVQRDPFVVDESLSDTLLDIAGYACLMAARAQYDRQPREAPRD